MLLAEFDGPKAPPLSAGQLDLLEVYLDKLFAAVNMDVEFTNHFKQQVNNIRNKRQITISELRQMFTKAYKKYNKGKAITNLGPDAQAVLTDMETDVNLPFVMVWDKRNREFDMVAKSVMRKKNFGTSNKKLTV